MESRQEESKTPKPRQEAKLRRFRLVKLEERIAPKCGDYTCKKCVVSGCLFGSCTG
jgi:hypothetical protein